MEKLKMHTPDLSQDNIAKIRELFPGCVTEAKDETTGKIRLAVDFDQLRQELSDSIVEGPQERYRLDWPGKREALALANAPIAKTLRPCREESVDFDTTKNLFIEGDNLEVLKVLQGSYLGQVKLIYIDPPYNTGRDFIYDDDFSENSESYLLESRQVDEQGSRGRIIRAKLLLTQIQRLLRKRKSILIATLGIQLVELIECVFERRGLPERCARP